MHVCNPSTQESEARGLQSLLRPTFKVSLNIVRDSISTKKQEAKKRRQQERKWRNRKRREGEERNRKFKKKKNPETESSQA